MSPPKQLIEVIRTWSEVFMQHSMTSFRQFMNETGLSFPQINVLMRLYHGKHCGVSEIGTHMGVTNAAASQVVDRLVQMDFVKRIEDPKDRRAKILSLSDNGQAFMEKGLAARSQWLEDLTGSLTLDEQELIFSALTILIKVTQKSSN